MAVAVGSFNVPIGTGNVSVTGLPFQPVAVVFFNTVQGEAPPGNMLGCSSGPGEQWVIWTGMDAETSGYNIRYNEGRSDCCIYNRVAPFTAVRYQASMVSLNADGFTVNFTTRSGTGLAIDYMAIGGLHIEEAHAGTFAAGSATGTTAVTAPGFLPTALIVAHTRAAAFDAGQQGDMTWGVGVADGTNQFSSFTMGNQGQPLEAYSIHRTDEVACANNAGEIYRLALQSFDPTGFTVNVTDAYTSNITHGYLAINADVAVAGNGVQPDATGLQAFAVPGLTPGGVFFCWNGLDGPSTTGNNSVPTRPGVGAFTDTDARAISMIFRDSTSFGVWNPDGYRSTVAGILIRGTGDGIFDPPAHDPHGVGAFSSFDPGSFAINWTTATSGADGAFGWLALPGEIPGGWIPQIYRRVVPA